MRIITLAIIHCSATPQGVRLSFDDCRREHIRRGFCDIGYHFYITRNGEIHRGRPLEKIGAHCQNHNRHSIGICYEGGLDIRGTPADTRTPAQRASLVALLRELKRIFPKILVVGHHDLNPMKGKHPIKYPFSLLYFHCTFAFAILHELLTYFHYDTRTI